MSDAADAQPSNTPAPEATAVVAWDQDTMPEPL